MRGASRGRPFKPWLTLFGGIVLVLATGPSPQQGAGVLRLSGVGLAATGATSAETIVCPGVADRLPAVPAAAREEVDRNLALLEKQIAEANARLVSSAGEGGPNFVRNAILGPLEDKRVATINRIATAIGRVAARPEGLVALAPCALSGAGASAPTGTAAPTATAAPTGTAAPTAAPTGGATAPASGRTIVCPGVKDRLPQIPAAAREEVERNLAQLDKQIAEANARLAASVGQGGPNFVRNAILGPLEDKRAAAIDRIAIAIGRVAARPTGLERLAACSLSTSGTPGSSASATEAPQAADPAAIGPAAEDFVDIRQVARAEQPRSTGRGSRGTFLSRCGVPEESHANQDNLIIAPGVQDGAQQLVDYVGNTTADAFSTNESLAASTTTCANRGDLSAYFWPALRTRAAGDLSAATTATDTDTGSSTGSGAEAAAPADPEATDLPTDVPTDLGPTDLPAEAGATDLAPESGATDFAPESGATDFAPESGATDSAPESGATDLPDDTLTAQPDSASTAQPGDTRQAVQNNVGTPVEPVAVRIQYRGNPTSRVTAMPRFLRLLSGDPRALTNGDANVRAAWSCTGFTDRLTDKYPICPSGSDLVRVHDMPSCWDGENTDSATHRSHLVFPGEDGACPSGTRAVPQLRVTLVYGELPTDRPEGTDVPFALDSFASERHAPQTAHAGAVVVMSDRLMRTVVRCINSGRNC
ncbi:DUF1996 domain-containing protein, partial [Nonomuraea sp. RK-328]|nr:DUF1996 domain-containing protein [Nonomuraea sp. RK-328]